MIGFYNYTVWLTFFSLVSSSFGILQAVSGHPLRALLFLMLSGVCDMFDGKIARTRKDSTEQEKKFGVQLDSLADIVCFGVLPAAIAIAIQHYYFPGVSMIVRVGYLMPACLLVLCALIRLAFFNVTEEERQSKTTERRTSYIGLPVTTSALIFPLAYALFIVTYNSPSIFTLVIYPAAMFITAICFIAPIPVRKAHGWGLVGLSLIGLAEAAFLAWALFLR